jgi:hypothetical protein
MQTARQQVRVRTPRFTGTPREFCGESRMICSYAPLKS